MCSSSHLDFEGYGMAYAEAVAHGLPVIGTTAGAIPETVPPDAGLLVPASNVPAFASALRQVVGDDGLRRADGQCRARGGHAASDLATVSGSLRACIGNAEMTGFSAEWLALREPYDARARNPEVLEAVAAFLKPLPSVRVIDLACGTGSTLRALSPCLPARQNWQLVDNDVGLLMYAQATPLAKDIDVTVIPLDLNRDLEAALDGEVDLVATSALLDLVSDCLAGPTRARARRALDPALRSAEL